MTKTKKNENKRSLYDELIEMAEDYNVQDNAMFLAAANQYQVQQRVINLIEESIDGADLTTEKTYLKGTTNSYASPLVKELPKHSDSANRTLQVMLDIVVKLGRKSEKESALSKFERDHK